MVFPIIIYVWKALPLLPNKLTIITVPQLDGDDHYGAVHVTPLTCLLKEAGTFVKSPVVLKDWPVQFQLLFQSAGLYADGQW